MAVAFEKFREALLDPESRDQIGLDISEANAQALLGNEEWANNYYLTWHVMTHEPAPPAPSYKVRTQPAPVPSVARLSYPPPSQLPYQAPVARRSGLSIVLTSVAIVVGAGVFLLLGIPLYAAGMTVWAVRDGPTGFTPTEYPGARDAIVADLMAAAGMPSEEDLLAAGYTTGEIRVQEGNLFEAANTVCRTGPDAPGLKESFVENFVGDDPSFTPQAENLWVVIVEYCESN